jgi:hypothetical protein
VRECVAGPSLERRVAGAAKELASPISVVTLPRLMKHAGYDSADWDIHEEWLRLRKGKRRIKLALDKLLCDALEERARLSPGMTSPVNTSFQFDLSLIARSLDERKGPPSPPPPPMMMI